jgi:hypothetical protein
VIEADAGDDADDGLDDVRRIEAAAGADLDDGDIDLPSGKPEISDGGSGFSVARGAVYLV